MKYLLLIFGILLIISANGKSQSNSQPLKDRKEFPILKGPYLGQKPPGLTPEVFAPGIVSTDNHELNSVFSPDGKYFLFSRETKQKGKTIENIMISHLENSNWTKPRALIDSKTQTAIQGVDMFFAKDGRTLYFINNLPTPEFKEKSVNIWISRWGGNGWLPPELLPPPVNSNSRELYPVIVNNGSMYFSSNREGGMGSFDLYRVQYNNGSYENLQNLGPTINTKFSEKDVYIAPDESYMIISSSGRPDSFGGSDLYTCFKKQDGSWGETVNLGESVNSKEHDYCPILTPDGKYFFFTRSGDIYWVDAKIIKKKVVP